MNALDKTDQPNGRPGDDSAGAGLPGGRKKSARLTKILWVQSLGFLAIIALSWLDELLDLPSLIFKNQPYVADFRKSALEMLLILGVWLLVVGTTRRMLERVQYLEGFLRVCAWCRRIDYKGRWMPLEQFMEQGFDTPTSHGICKECLRKQNEAIERARRAKQLRPAAASTGKQ